MYRNVILFILDSFLSIWGVFYSFFWIGGKKQRRKRNFLVNLHVFILDSSFSISVLFALNLCLSSFFFMLIVINLSTFILNSFNYSQALTQELFHIYFQTIDSNAEAHRWEIIYKISLGIAKGLDHLHTGLQKPLIHGNLKSNNILLEDDYRPRISDYGLHLLLNPTFSQEMLEAAAAQGYKAPELIKMKEATKESDIYSMGVIFLEMLTRKEPVNNNFLHSKDQHLPTSLRNLVLEHNISNIFSSELVKQSKHRSGVSEECLLKYFQVAMACCSPSPALRPDIKQVVRKLEEIER